MANEITIKVKAIDAASGVFNAITSRLGESGRLIQQTFTGNFAGAIETGVGMAIDYTAEAIDKVIELDGKVQEISRITGQSLEESSRLIKVAEDMGVSYADLAAGLGGATKKGVDTSIESILGLVGEYKKLNDPETGAIDRARFLTDNFGAAGAGLAPIFEAASVDIVTAMDNVNEALVWDSEKQQNIDDYQKAVNELKTSFDGLKMTVGMGFIPVLVDLLEGLQGNRDWFVKTDEAVGQIGVTGGLSAEQIAKLKEQFDKSGEAAATATGQVDGLGSSINRIQDKTVSIHVNTYHNDIYGSAESYARTAQLQQARQATSHASGGLFEIPMMYGNEGFRLGNGDTASGGEGLQIIPKNQMNKSENPLLSKRNDARQAKLIGKEVALAMIQYQVNG
jgi:hypothetical protein